MGDIRDISPDNVPAELTNTSWHIPRPTLARSSKSSNDSPPSSTNSTQSARSGSLLLTAATIAQIHRQMDSSPSTRQKNLQYYLRQVDSRSELLPSSVKKPPPDPDSLSLASSTHFTVINVNSRPGSNKRSVCRRHQNTILVLTMCTLITIGILAAIFFLEMRAKNRQH